MSKKVPFTEEQLRVLELNPYTYSVSSNRITFTLEFKKFCADVFLKKEILSKDFVLHEAFLQNNSLLHSRQKIFLPKKQMPVSKNYRNGLFI